MTRRSIIIYLMGIGLLLASMLAWYATAFATRSNLEFGEFNGQRALIDVETQVSFGPRIPGSEGHTKVLEWIQSELSAAGWQSRIQSTEMLGHPIQNIVAFRNSDTPRIILAAHFDTRIQADNDPDPSKRASPVPGANDGASGVAVLLELARSLPEESIPVWLVFFDAEDNGRIPGWDWTLGSQAFADQLSFTPEAVIVVDMIGDANLNIYIERSSDKKLSSEIWGIADELGYADQFIPEEKYSIHDDHTPFLQKGIPALDIIDFDYPFWHTTADTLDKVSADSLQVVGETLSNWLAGRSGE